MIPLGPDYNNYVWTVMAKICPILFSPPSPSQCINIYLLLLKCKDSLKLSSTIQLPSLAENPAPYVFKGVWPLATCLITPLKMSRLSLGIIITQMRTMRDRSLALRSHTAVLCVNQTSRGLLRICLLLAGAQQKVESHWCPGIFFLPSPEGMPAYKNAVRAQS